MQARTAWPSELEGTPAIAVLERAIASGRLSHGLLLQGENSQQLLGVAHAIADRLLNVPGASAHFAPEQHPDCFHLRPTGKMRQINAENTRDLINKIQVSPAVSPNKVAILVEADRLHLTSANIFLKTLEEPPAGTTILLLTTRPYALLPTIRSRVQSFRFPASSSFVDAMGWPEWMADYQAWLARLASSKPSRKGAAEHIFALYGLIARFSMLLELATAEQWNKQKEKLPPDLKDEEQEAMETGISNGLRARLFADIEKATRGFAIPALAQGDDALRNPLTETVDALERCFGLLNVNLNESAALEDFLLATLRIWTRR
jgi:DNA polymerase-3 subunit delta'